TISKRDWSSDVCSSDLSTKKQRLSSDIGFLCKAGGVYWAFGYPSKILIRYQCAMFWLWRFPEQSLPKPRVHPSRSIYRTRGHIRDRKSTRLNSSHVSIS